MAIIVSPCCEFSAEFDACASSLCWLALRLHRRRALGLRDGADQIDREMSDDGHVSRAMALAQAGLVLGEDGVEHPAQLVLDAPLATHGLAGMPRRERRRGDVIAGLAAAAVG